MSKHNNKVTFEEADELLEYNPDTGRLFWKVYKKGRRMDKEAGCLNKINRYRYISLNGALFLSHRLVWLLAHGEFPSDEIDHIDGVKDNNKLCNLRSVNHSENQRNTPIRSNNKSGHMGIHFNKNRNKWQADIYNNEGVREYLGLYTELQDAVQARKAAEVKYGYHPNHGKPTINKGVVNV